MKDLVIIGADRFGQEAARIVQAINEKEQTWNLLGFIDDETGETPENCAVLGNLEYLLAREDKLHFALAVVNSENREKIAARCKEAGLIPATIIHPETSQYINPNSTIGEGVIFGPGGSTSVNVKLGKFCLIRSGCNFGHDANIKDYSTVMDHTLIAGDTVIGAHNFLGFRSTMINLVSTVDHCTFGACACIVKNATVPGIYEGVPARLVETLEK